MKVYDTRDLYEDESINKTKVNDTRDLYEDE